VTKSSKAIKKPQNSGNGKKAAVELESKGKDAASKKKSPQKKGEAA
jgi:hypothetical protein